MRTGRVAPAVTPPDAPSLPSTANNPPSDPPPDVVVHESPDSAASSYEDDDAIDSEADEEEAPLPEVPPRTAAARRASVKQIARRLSVSVRKLPSGPIPPVDPTGTSADADSTKSGSTDDNTDGTDNIKVFVRIRPSPSHDAGAAAITPDANPGQLTINDRSSNGPRTYTFDGVLKDDATQEECYNAVAGAAVRKVCRGVHATVFAYGQTGSGKTHTMLGYEDSAEQLGVIPRALADLFAYVEQAKGKRVCDVEVSVLEIYNEQLRDLGGGLGPAVALKGTQPKLEIHEGRGGLVMVRNLTRFHVADATETLTLLGSAIDARTVGATDANATSSRSHLIFTVSLTQTDVGDTTGASTMIACLNLVDLAGSERQSSTGATGVRLKEGANINKSLSSLGKVIAALARNEKFVPYRDSKLTRLLQSSLGGNSYTVMLACVSASVPHVKVSLSTLRFADSAKRIVNSPTVNVDPTTLRLRELTRRCAELEAQNEGLRTQVGALTSEVATLRNGGGGVDRGTGGAGVGSDEKGVQKDENACCVIS